MRYKKYKSGKEVYEETGMNHIMSAEEEKKFVEDLQKAIGKAMFPQTKTEEELVKETERSRRMAEIIGKAIVGTLAGVPETEGSEELQRRVERAEERASQAVKDRELLRHRVLELERERDALRRALRSLKEEG